MTITVQPLVQRWFTKAEQDPWKTVEWGLRTVQTEHGPCAVEAPTSWSDTAVKIAVTKYFGQTKKGEPESSIKQMISRVVETLVFWGLDYQYFGQYGQPGQLDDTVASEGAGIFRDELIYIFLHQYAALNTPAWVNFGAYGHEPQASACFLSGINDSMDSIMETAVDMATIFKNGSGVGVNLSPLRASKEALTGGGFASGPMSFAHIFNSVGQVVKSGGKTRRAALMIELNDDHPDIEQFVVAKANEEAKAQLMIDGAQLVQLMRAVPGCRSALTQALTALAADYAITPSTSLLEALKLLNQVSQLSIDDAVLYAASSGNWLGFSDNTAYTTVGYQNMNTSVSISDAFMKKVAGIDENDDWYLLARRSTNVVGYHEIDMTAQGMHVYCGGEEYLLVPDASGDAYAYEILGCVSARALFKMITTAAWQCGDPGLQFIDTINAWNPVPNVGRIHGSNPCGEVYLPDYLSCNLCSIRLTKFYANGIFDVDTYQHVIRMMATAQDISISGSVYPTERIAKHTKEVRALGLGVADLGALLMKMCLPYDSSEGRTVAASLLSLLTATAYRQSVVMAQHVGPAASFVAENLIPILEGHRAAVVRMEPTKYISRVVIEEMYDSTMDDALISGLRNCAVSCCAPTGTISFLLDCATTGIEPEFALVKTKSLVGGGTIDQYNTAAVEALTDLEYTENEQKSLFEHVKKTGRAGGWDGWMLQTHEGIFHGAMEIDPFGHLAMVAAIQPCISMGISKTISLPNEATPEDIEAIYLEAWHQGVKGVTIYRDGCKKIQPLTAGTKTDTAITIEDILAALPVRPNSTRKRLPIDRTAITHKFEINGHEGYITVGLYDDGSPGEVFVRMSKQGSTIAGLMDGLAIAVSIALQYGVPLDVLVEKFVHTRFEPAGWTNNPQIRIAKSLLDYLFRWLAGKFLSEAKALDYGVKLEQQAGLTKQEQEAMMELDLPESKDLDGEPCPSCGALMTRKTGSCYYCDECQSSAGGCS